MKRSTRLLPFLILGFILGASNLLGSGCATHPSQDFGSISERYSTDAFENGDESTATGEEDLDEEEESGAEPEEDMDAAEEPTSPAPAPEPEVEAAPARKLSSNEGTGTSLSSGSGGSFGKGAPLPPAPPQEKPLVDRLARVIQERAKQRFGNAAYLFDVPKEMKPGDTAKSTLTLALGEVADELKKTVRSSGILSSGEIKGITLTIDAKLDGAGIETKAIGRSEQSLDDNGKAKWSWLLTAASAEKYEVFLSVSAVYVTEGSDQREYVLIHQEERTLGVLEGPLAGIETGKTTQAAASTSWWGKLVGGGIGEAFKWIWLTLLLPPLKLLWNRHQSQLEKKSSILSRLFGLLRRLRPSQGETPGKS